ncbi:MAG: DUF3800 domain-containing protein [Anaerolineae bacterium]|nr:DUF3800 domain-containing protein [Anaerolineae bacterium]
MYIAYYDESGDDGFPDYSSPLFVLTAIYLEHQNWQQAFNTIAEFRREMKAKYGLPVRIEMHAREFLLNKNPYCTFRIPDSQRVESVGHFCRFIGSLDLRIINVVIVKDRIRKKDYDVLDKALTFSVQRLENDLRHAPTPDEEKFLMITDSGRVGKMRKTTRRLRRFNPIPSKTRPGTYRQQEITTMIEDPLPKDSKESYFIQLADLVSYVVYLHAVNATGVASYPRRLQGLVSGSTVEQWMDALKPRLNLDAARKDPYGIKYHPGA